MISATTICDSCEGYPCPPDCPWSVGGLPGADAQKSAPAEGLDLSLGIPPTIVFPL